ncbi:iron-containing alcohol dehydrogenase [Lactococcus lactis]|uniref:iron-containing alcohol dehydrogenase n=1 Tax=Lactococcus lactis TaxID=1358 RepID=UPI002026D8C5|nr:iron-containing alcohol dehydrogenase [Lactococcus lactis]MCL9640843.1 iron-containing alcohol dehydrogenase [Lactococcus lactis]
MVKQFEFKPSVTLLDHVSDFLRVVPFASGDLIVTNRYIIDAFDGLYENKVAQFLYLEDYFKTEPTDVALNQILLDLQDRQITRIFAVGGGSVIDVSKCLVYKTAQSFDDIQAMIKLETPAMRDLVILPTTTGTGSEVTNVSVFNREALGTKIGLVSDAFYAKQVVLIPELAKGMPYPVFIASAIDALSHAIESFLSPKSTILSQTFSKEAIERLISELKKVAVTHTIPNLKSLNSCLIASTMAGVAFSNAGCGPVHAVAYPIGAKFHLPHGRCIALCLVPTLKQYRQLGVDLSELSGVMKENADFSDGLDWLCSLDDLIMSILSDSVSYNLTEQECIEFSNSVMDNQERLLKCAPVHLQIEDVHAIFKDIAEL